METAHADRRADAPGAHGARRARRHEVRRGPPPVPAGGVRARRPVGARQVRARSASPTPTWRRPPTAVRPWSAPARGPTPRLRPCCSTPTTTSSRRSTRTPGTRRRSSSPRSTGAGTDAEPQTARATSSCTWRPCAPSATDLPVNLKLVVEGSEEQGTGGLEAFVPEHADLLRADMILVCDTGNAAVGVPAATVSLRGMVNVVVTVEALAGELHSGMFGGPAPDALAALVAMLATLRDERGQHHGPRARQHARRGRVSRTRPSSSARTPACSTGPRSLGGGSVSDMLWARPALTILGIDCPPVVGSAAADHTARSGAAEPPHPAGHGPGGGARRPGRAPPRGRALGRAGDRRDRGDGRAVPRRHRRPRLPGDQRGDAEAFGRPMASLGQGGSIPLCNVFADTYPDAEIILMGVEEPQAPHPRTQRERGPDRDREDGARRGPVPAGLREPTLTAVPRRVTDRSPATRRASVRRVVRQRSVTRPQEATADRA